MDGEGAGALWGRVDGEKRLHATDRPHRSIAVRLSAALQPLEKALREQRRDPDQQRPETADSAALHPTVPLCTANSITAIHSHCSLSLLTSLISI